MICTTIPLVGKIECPLTQQRSRHQAVWCKYLWQQIFQLREDLPMPSGPPRGSIEYENSLLRITIGGTWLQPVVGT
jgi:hypothetical protein